MITGCVRVDLTTVEREKQRHRIAALHAAPDQADVVVYVGPMAPEPDCARLLIDQGERLNITIEGEPFAVKRWLALLREGLIV